MDLETMFNFLLNNRDIVARFNIVYDTCYEDIELSYELYESETSVKREYPDIIKGKNINEILQKTIKTIKALKER